MDSYKRKVIRSELDSDWSVVSFTNGYYFTLSSDIAYQAVTRIKVPRGILKELGPIAQARICD